VVLLDEIEKAHPDVFNILLQILEDGRLTDAQGRTVDFRNTIIIMTSNIGAGTISKGQVLGFGEPVAEGGLEYEEMKSRVTGELKKIFRPEFLNRVGRDHRFPQALAGGDSDIAAWRCRGRGAAWLTARSAWLTPAAKELLVDGHDPTMGGAGAAARHPASCRRPGRRGPLRQVLERSTVLLEREDDHRVISEVIQERPTCLWPKRPSRRSCPCRRAARGPSSAGNADTHLQAGWAAALAVVSGTR
jgi:hypothetical protein